MKEVIEDVTQWLKEKKPVALATVVQTWGSAPRTVGAKMALTPNGAMSGSVSGGCVEGAVFEEGTAALEANPAQATALWRSRRDSLGCGTSLRRYD